MFRRFLFIVALTTVVHSAHAAEQHVPDWQTVQYRSEAWVWGWTTLDIFSIANSWKISQESAGKARRTRAQAAGIRASLGLWSVWKNQPAYFSLTSAPTETQKLAQIQKANEIYHWKSRLPNLAVNTVLAAWIMEEGDKENAAISFVSGLFWGEVSLLTQRMLDTDWLWRVREDRVELQLNF